MPEFLVTSPSGHKYKVTAPEGATEDEVLARVQAEPGAMQGAKAEPEEGGVMGAVKGLASYGTGLLRGGAGLIGAIPDVNNLIVRATGGGPTSPRMMPGGSEDIKRLAQQATGLEAYQPKSQMEKFLAAGGEGQAAIAPANKMQALVGAVAGLGGEAAANHPWGTDHPELARIVGQLGVLLPSMPFAMRTPAAVKAAQSYATELGPEGLRAADAERKAAAATLGKPTLLTQGAPHQELSGVVQALAASPYGGDVRKVLRDQLPAGEALMDSMYKGLPGGPGQDVADAVLAVGKAAVQAPKDFRASQTKPLYDAAKADLIDPAPIRDAILKARQDLNIPAAIPPGKAMRRMEEMVGTAAGKQVPVLELDTVSRMAKDAAERARLSGDSIKMKANRAVADAIDEATRAGSPNLERAAAEHKSLSESLVNPVEQSLGTMFPEKMRMGKTGDWSVFQKALDNAEASEVASIGTHLRRVDPSGEAFPSIFRQSLEKKAEAALAPVQGRAPPDAFNSFANEVAGAKGSTKREAFQAKVTQVALAQGKDPAAAVRGADDAIDALFVISRDRGGGIAGAQDLNTAAKDWLSRLLQSASFTAPLRGVGYARELATSKQLAKDLSEAFTSPTGVDKLLEIARYSPTKQKLKSVSRGLLELEIPNADQSNSN